MARFMLTWFTLSALGAFLGSAWGVPGMYIGGVGIPLTLGLLVIGTE